jgi:L-methionine (R)-S-oxide reductase
LLRSSLLRNKGFRSFAGPAWLCFNTGMSTDASGLSAELTALASTACNADALMHGIADLLHQKLVKYNWVGFYMIQKDGNQEILVLGPFRGTMTPHTRIPLNQGICGAAASTGKTVVVDDVNNDPRYLACSLETKSEIVVPIFVRGKVVGELDIDSHFLAAFAAEDRQLCEHAAALVGRFLESHP